MHVFVLELEGVFVDCKMQGFKDAKPSRSSRGGYLADNRII